MLDVAVTESNAEAPSPMWNVKVSGVSSFVVLSVMSCNRRIGFERADVHGLRRVDVAVIAHARKAGPALVGRQAGGRGRRVVARVEQPDCSTAARG